LFFPSFTGKDSESSFFGDNIKNWNGKLTLKCYYEKNISPKKREKFGIADEISAIVYVSPKELYEKTGKYRLSNLIMKKATGIKVTFDSRNYSLEEIIDKENTDNESSEFSIGIELRLKQVP